MIKFFLGLVFCLFASDAKGVSEERIEQRMHISPPICYLELPTEGRDGTFSILGFFEDSGYRLRRLPRIDCYKTSYFLSKKKQLPCILELCDHRSFVGEKIVSPVTWIGHIISLMNSIVPEMKSSIAWPILFESGGTRYHLIQNADLMQWLLMIHLYEKELEPGEILYDEVTTIESINILGSDFLKKAKWLAFVYAIHSTLVIDLCLNEFSYENYRDRVPLFLEEDNHFLGKGQYCLVLSSSDCMEHYLFFPHGLIARLKVNPSATSPIYIQGKNATFTYAGFCGQWGKYSENKGVLHWMVDSLEETARWSIDTSGRRIMDYSGKGVYQETDDKDLLAACCVLPERKKGRSEKYPVLLQLEKQLAWWTRGVLLHQELFPLDSPIRQLYQLRQCTMKDIKPDS